MKTIIFLAATVLAICPKVLSQCTEPLSVPFTITSDQVTIPELPECMHSNYSTFASTEIFKTNGGPVNGFTGNVLVYDTTINIEFGMPADTGVMAYLLTPQFQLNQGTTYTISYKYANSDSQKTISSLTVEARNSDSGIIIPVGQHDNITGATAATYVSQPFTAAVTGIYIINFIVISGGTQGLLYLDDITIQEASGLTVQNNKTNYISIYPNPVQDVLHISHTSEIQKAAIYNLSGQLIKSYAINGLSADINMQQYTNGIYIVAITSDNRTENIKIIKQ